jgi:hypothetical protein
MKASNIKSFIVSLIFSFLVFSFGFLNFIPIKNTVNVAKKNTNAPYEGNSSKALGTVIFIKINETSSNFLIELNSDKEQISSFYFNDFSINNSTESFNRFSAKEACLDFFGIKPQKTLYLSEATLKSIINLTGGIGIAIPYGISSPSNKDLTLAFDSNKQQIFGETVLQILKEDTYPSYEKQLYYSEILATVMKNVLNNINNELFEFISENAKTDISYADFIDHQDALKQCSKNITFSAAKGVWLNNNYYLQ